MKNTEAAPATAVREGSTSSNDDGVKEKSNDDINWSETHEQSSTRIVDPEILIHNVSEHEKDKTVRYDTCKWWNVGLLMIAEVISLGVLALPQAVASLGLIPGIFTILGLGIISTYTGYLIGQFRLAYPSVRSFADCGQIIAGPIGREVMAFAQVLVLIFIMAAHVLSFSLALNAMTEHATCTVAFSTAGLVLSFVLALPRTWEKVSYLSIFSCLSILIAVLITMIAIGVQKPDIGNVYAVNPNIPLVTALGPVMNIVLAYAGHVAFFSFISELRDPREFTKSLCLLQITSTTFYIIISVVIYYYAGPHVASPALGSASPTITKITFGIAIPTIVIAGVVNGNVACKYIYFRMWDGTDVVYENSVKSWASWVGVCGTGWTVAWIVAEAIPNFNLLLGLIAALFCAWFSFGLPAILFLYQYKGRYFENKKRAALTVLNVGIVVFACAVNGLGMWSSGTALYRGSAGKPFSCEDNWNTS